MRETEARQTIASKVFVLRQHVTIAKTYILRHFEPDTRKLLHNFLSEQNCQMPTEIVLHPNVNPETVIAQAAESILWQVALGEAVWALIHDGLLMPASPDLTPVIQPHLKWATVVPGSGGYSSGWRFEEFDILLPGRVRLAPSFADAPPQYLADGDLFLAEMDIPDIHPEIGEALRDAVRCFRHELYVPCLAMLAKASEGAWIELGLSLLKFASEGTGLRPETVDKMRDELSSPFVSIAQKIQTVTQLYDRQDVFESVKKRSGVSNRHLRNATVWSDVVRDSRNVVHYGADPATANTYEKVAALLLGAAPHLQMVYRIRRAAEELASVPS